VNQFVIIVDFLLKPGKKNYFRNLIDHNARESCNLEPGCSRFDVLESSDENRLVLYEIYKDRLAFEAHQKTSHFTEFNQKSADLVLSKNVEEFNLVCEGSVVH
jgi:autoinducer 2-degrading protein